MDTILNNRVTDTILTNNYTLCAAIVLVTIVVLIYFLYNVLYDGANGSHFMPLVKVFVVSSAVGAILVYLQGEKQKKKTEFCLYDELI